MQAPVRDEATAGFQEEEESADKARAQSNASVPVTLPDESAGKSSEDIMIAAPTEGEDDVHTGSARNLRAMAVRHGSQDSASPHIDAEVHLADRLVDGDLGEHVGIPSTEQIASVADQAAKMRMSKLGSSAQLHRDEQFYAEMEESAMIDS